MVKLLIGVTLLNCLVACSGQNSQMLLPKPEGQVVGNGKEVTLIETSSDGVEVSENVRETSDSVRRIEFLFDLSEDGKFTLSDRAKITYLESGELEKIPTTGQSFEVDNLNLTLTDSFLLVSDGKILAHYDFNLREWEISHF